MQTTIPKFRLVTDSASPKLTQIDHDSTLPDGKVDTALGRPVMWHGPDPIGSGSRSEVPQAAVLARGVTVGVLTPAGAGLAGTADAHPAQTGEHTWPAMASTVMRSNGDATTAHSSRSTNSILDVEEWRQRVERVRHRAHAESTEDGAFALTEAQAFDIVKLARALVAQNKANRKARKDTDASSATRADYAKKCNFIDRKMDELEWESEPLWTVMGRLATNKQTFRAFKAALKSRQIARIQDLLISQDALQRAGEKGDAWRRHLLHLNAAMREFIEFDMLDRDECLAFTGHKNRPGRSKRRDLPHLPQGWQDRFLEIVEPDSTYYDAGILLRYGGLRPIELEKGVKVSATPRGIEVKILGGKTRETAGQPWRSFVVDPNVLPISFVRRVRMDGDITVVAAPGALRAYLHRLSDRVFLQGKFKQEGAWKKSFVLSAYSFRHAFVTDLREAGWDTETIAMAIGESSAQTVSYYGTRSRKVKSPKNSAVLKESVQAARPVRSVNLDGLKQVQANKDKSRKKMSHMHPKPSP